MKPSIQYIQFVMPLSVQKNPLIYYVTEHLETPKIMVYSSFIKYLLREFNINDRKGIIQELDSFRNIFLDNLTGEYQIIEPDKEELKKVTHDQLLKLNQRKPPETFVEKGLNRLHVKVNEFRNSLGLNARNNSNRR